LTEQKVSLGLALPRAPGEALQRELLRAGYEVHISLDSLGLAGIPPEVSLDAWIFDASAEHMFATLHRGKGVLFPARVPQLEQHVAAWSAAMLQEVDGVLGRIPERRPAAYAAWKNVQAVWLLAGSAGASAAVQRFLSSFRKTPPVAFLYAQHYDPVRQEQLEQLTASNELFHMELIHRSCWLSPGRVAIVPPRQRILFGPCGELRCDRDGWSGSHTPDIDELEILFAAAPLPASGIILFSGMGSDGSGNLDVLDSSGTRIWAQDIDSAICRGIPQSAMATGRVHRSGTPEALALALSQLYV